MYCNICKIDKLALRTRIENLLEVNSGILTDKDKADLIAEFPDQKEAIQKITDQDCNMHWNFHQSIMREPIHAAVVNEKMPKGESLAGDIQKDEAFVLYEMMNTQAATFNLFTKKINTALMDEDADVSGIIVNPNTSMLYKEIGESLRATIREIRGMNVEVNGSKSGSNEGLKALAKAILGGKDTPEEKEEEDLTTKEFDGD